LRVDARRSSSRWCASASPSGLSAARFGDGEEQRIGNIICGNEEADVCAGASSGRIAGLTRESLWGCGGHLWLSRFVVNGRTGTVSGERPYSWIKITLTVLAALALIGVIIFLLHEYG
jgi:hypothetical protein